MSDPFFSLAVRQSDTGTVVSVAGEIDVATLGVLLGAWAACRTMRVKRRSGGAVARLLALTGTETLLGCRV
jgi:hypothetical protein